MTNMASQDSLSKEGRKGVGVVGGWGGGRGSGVRTNCHGDIFSSAGRLRRGFPSGRVKTIDLFFKREGRLAGKTRVNLG